MPDTALGDATAAEVAATAVATVATATVTTTTTVADEESALPLPTAASGVVLRPGAYERIIALLHRAIGRLGADESPRELGIPPVIARGTIERAGYPASFPHLLGTVHRFTGDAAQWSALSELVETGGDWQRTHQPSDLVLLPASCYPVYASLEGRELDRPHAYHVLGTCFRQEATSEAGRLRSFRMSELVAIGDAEHCEAWRDRRLEQVADWFRALGLKVTIQNADDPFFGAGSRVYKAAQRRQRLKFELCAPLEGDLVQAITSANWHKEHFGEAFGISVGGAPANTACMGFGIDRIALALLHAHGPHPDRWPADVTAALVG